MAPICEKIQALTYTVSLSLIVIFACRSLLLCNGMIGKEVNIDEHPYYAFTETGDTRCGAVIVDEWYAMTAASCVKEWKDTPVQLYLGSAKANDDQALFEEADKVCIPNKNDGTSHDFSLLRMANKLEFTDNIKSTKLYNETGQHNAKWWKTSNCVALGGGIYDSEGAAGTLRKSRVRLVECSDDESIVCYRHLDKRHTTCKEDEGGPIFCKRSRDGKSEMELVAIITNSSESCEEETENNWRKKQAFSASWLQTFIETSFEECIKFLTTASRGRGLRAGHRRYH